MGSTRSSPKPQVIAFDCFYIILEHLPRKSKLNLRLTCSKLCKIVNKKIHIYNNRSFYNMCKRNAPLYLIKNALENENVQPNFNNSISFNHAVKYNNIDVLKLLLKDSRINPSDHQNYAIRSSMFHNRWEIIKLLLNDVRLDLSINYDRTMKKLLKSKIWDIMRIDHILSIAWCDRILDALNRSQNI